MHERRVPDRGQVASRRRLSVGRRRVRTHHRGTAIGESEAEVIIENSVESYMFTCTECGARWTESFEVSQSVDEEGEVRAFYRHHGSPCEAPAGENVECP